MKSLVDYKLVVNEVSLKNKPQTGNFKINPDLSRTIDRIEDNKASVTYVLEINDKPDNPFPVDIRISITGIFDLSKLQPESVDDFLEVQTCQILFPQIRSILSGLTASALMPPIMLPIVDARTVFKK